MEGLIFGVRTIYSAGASAIHDAALNFDAPLAAAWDDENEWINVGIDPVSSTSHGAVVATAGAAKVLVAGASAASWAKLVDANVDAAAAIAGTKVDPDFGAQLVETTGLMLAANYRSAAANTETLGANKVLTVADSRWQNIDPTVAVYTVELPAVTPGLAFHIYNPSSWGLAVKNPGGGSTLVTVAAGASRWVACAAAAWEDHGP